jgi:hypothetical protein
VVELGKDVQRLALPIPRKAEQRQTQMEQQIPEQAVVAAVQIHQAVLTQQLVLAMVALESL